MCCAVSCQEGEEKAERRVKEGMEEKKIALQKNYISLTDRPIHRPTDRPPDPTTHREACQPRFGGPKRACGTCARVRVRISDREVTKRVVKGKKEEKRENRE